MIMLLRIFLFQVASKVVISYHPAFKKERKNVQQLSGRIVIGSYRRRGDQLERSHSPAKITEGLTGVEDLGAVVKAP